MRKHYTTSKFFCWLVLRLSKLSYGITSAGLRLKCLSRQTTAPLPCSDRQIIVAGPQAFHSERVPWLDNGGLALLCRLSRKPDCFWSIETFRAVAFPFDYSSTRQIRLQGEEALLTMNNCNLPALTAF